VLAVLLRVRKQFLFIPSNSFITLFRKELLGVFKKLEISKAFRLEFESAGGGYLGLNGSPSSDAAPWWIFLPHVRIDKLSLSMDIW